VITPITRKKLDCARPFRWKTRLAQKSRVPRVRAATCRRASYPPPSSDRDDDLALRVTLTEVGECLGRVLERVLAVDDGLDRPGLEQLAQDGEVAGRDLREEGDRLLAPADRLEARPEEVGDGAQPAVRHPAADEDDRGVGRQDAPELEERAAAGDVENHVVPVGQSREVLPGVVDDAVRTAKTGPVTPYHSTGFTEDARTRTRT
jgi:hypothetical protein